MIRFGVQLRRLQGDERGTVTIEFMLWLPVLAFWLVASVAFFDAYKSRDDAAKAAHTLADIMSRQVEVSDGFFGELYALESKLLPRVEGAKTLRVTNIQYDAANDQHVVVWSEALGGGSPLTDAFVPVGLMPEMADLDTVILTEVSVTYAPFTDWAVADINEWSFALVSRPRFVSSIAMIEEPLAAN